MRIPPSLRTALAGALVVAFASAGAARGEETGRPAAPSTDAVLRAVRVATAGPLLGGDAPVWGNARETLVALQPQTVTAPMNPAPAVEQLRVRALHDGHWLALRLEWKDGAVSDVLRTDWFGDQVAIEFPIDERAGELPSPMMGNLGGRVDILQWRAALQRDLDEKSGLSIASLYPNAVADVYPDQILRPEDARPYQGALAVSNPVSRAKGSPVLDQVAEGWGSLTVKPEQRARGRGAWKGGAWRVVIAVPMTGGDEDTPRLVAGKKTWLAFAAWDGGRREVGARKSWSAWVPFEIAR